MWPVLRGGSDKGALSTLSHLQTSANPITINNMLNTTYFQLWTPLPLFSRERISGKIYIVTNTLVPSLWVGIIGLPAFKRKKTDRKWVQPNQFIEKTKLVSGGLCCVIGAISDQFSLPTSVYFHSGTSWQGKRTQDEKKKTLKGLRLKMLSSPSDGEPQFSNPVAYLYICTYGYL